MQVCFQHLKACQVMDHALKISNVGYDNNSKSNKLHDQIFWYKAEPRGDFKLGSKEFWEISKDLGSDDEEEVYNPNTPKKGTTRINVRKNKW